jgi:outer membrane protein W
MTRLLKSLAVASLATVSALSVLPGTAFALEHQHHIGLDPSLAMLKVDDKSSISSGAGLGVHYTYGINDQFNLMVEANGSIVARNQQQDMPESPHTRPAEVDHGLIGVGYVIDVLQWVPYFGLLTGGYRLAGGTLDKTLFVYGGALQVGLDYQFTRHWALGVAAQQHLLFTKMSTYPSYTTGMLRLEYMWGF